MATVSLQMVYDEARRWLETNDTERAIAVARHILRHHPNNLEAYRILGEASLAARDLETARTAFQRVLDSDPENIPAHVGLGITLERQGQLEQAIAEFEQALEIKPDMAELRTQLLRLYTEAWGNEGAHLRLSRAGLARLYAKGHMLAQAIQEFRSVIADQPGRFDARVALAEALWRDGQEDATLSLCKDLLRQREHALKPNLLLGYLLLSAGNPDGETFWRRAQALDPEMSVARAMFEILPPIGNQMPVIAEFDETEWQRERQQPAAAVAATASAAQPVAAATQEDDLFGGDWLVDPLPVTPPRTPVPSADDDFLASLLQSSSATPAQSSEPQPLPDVDLTLEPFSFDDLAGDDRPLQPFSLESLEDESSQPAVSPRATTPLSAPANDDAALDIDLQPFSLADLGLTEEEIAAVQGSQPAAPSAQRPPEEPDFGNLKPFSIEDWGLEPEPSPPPTPARSSAAPAVPPITPPAATPVVPPLPVAAEQAAPEGELGELKPFSLDELDLDVSDAVPDSLPPSLQPFSLDDISTDIEPAAPPEPPRSTGMLGSRLSQPREPVEPEQTGYSWREPRSGSSFARSSSASTGDSEPQLSIFAKLKQRREASGFEPPASELPPAASETDETTAAFSFDDLPLHEQQTAEPVALTDPAASAEPAADLPPAPVSPPLPAQLEPPASEAPELNELQPFSLEELGLSPEEIAALGMEPAPAQTAVQSGPAQDFDQDVFAGLDELNALSELSSTPEPPAASQLAAPSQDFSEISDISEAVASGELKPFSLEDLGLSPEEIAALGLGEPTTQTDEHELGITPEDLANFDDLLKPSPATPLAPLPPEIATGDHDVDALLRLGLQQGFVDITDIIGVVANPSEESERIETIGRMLHERGIQIRDGDEIIDMDEVDSEAEQSADLDLTGAPPAPFDMDLSDQPNWPPVEPEPESLQPFTLSELGLSSDEASGLDFDDALAAEQPASTPPPAPRAEEVPSLDQLQPFSLADLGLTPEEIAALGLGDAAPATEPAPETADAEPAVSQEPETEAVQPVPAETQPASLAELQPFSLADLGLTADEIAALESLNDVESLPATPSEPRQVSPEIEIRVAPEAEPVIPVPTPPLETLDDVWQVADQTIQQQAEPAQVDQPASSAEPPAAPQLPQVPELPLPPALAATTPEPAAPPAPQAELPAQAAVVEAPRAELPRREPPARWEPPRREPPRREETVPRSEVSRTPPRRETPRTEATRAETTRTQAGNRESRRSATATPPDVSNHPELAEITQQLESDPQNTALRIAVARLGGQVGHNELALYHYRQLIKTGELLDDVVDDLRDLIADTDEPDLLRRLHRVLGDAYSRQGRFREAVDEYGWTFSRN